MGQPTVLRVGFLGLGTMGAPMARSLLRSGVPLAVWNRTPAKIQPLLVAGAKAGKSPAHVAAETDIAITMLARPEDVEAVVLGPDGVLEGIRPGGTLIDMSTVSPATSRRLAASLTTKQAEFLDAPVIGSKGPAAEGTLIILVGGLPTTLERCRPVLAAMGQTIVYAGGVGMGSALKLAVNLMLSHLVAGFSEGLLLAQRSGLDPARYLEALGASTFRSPWYQTKGASMISRNFTAHFALKHMHKDLRLMRELAHETKTRLPITASIERLFADSEASGRGELDYSSILASLEGASGP